MPEKWTCWANPAVAFHAVIPIQVVAITSAYGYVQVNQAGARKQVNASQELMYRCIEGDVRPRSSRELRSWGKQKWNIGLNPSNIEKIRDPVGRFHATASLWKGF